MKYLTEFITGLSESQRASLMALGAREG